MGFFTSLHYYRQGVPTPRITGPDLANFIREIGRSGIVSRGSIGFIQCVVGDDPDSDDAPYDDLEDQGPGLYAEVEPFDYDLEMQRSCLADLADALDKQWQVIYRAQVSLGLLSEPLIERLNSQMWKRGREQNDRVLQLDSCSVQIWPVVLHSLRSNQLAYVSNLSVKLSGNGYMYPFSLQEWTHVLDTQPEVQRLQSICAETWPGSGDPPGARLVAGRQTEIAEFWPYDEADLPASWFWGPAEG